MAAAGEGWTRGRGTPKTLGGRGEAKIGAKGSKNGVAGGCPPLFRCRMFPFTPRMVPPPRPILMHMFMAINL